MKFHTKGEILDISVLQLSNFCGFVRANIIFFDICKFMIEKQVQEDLEMRSYTTVFAIR